MYCEYAGKTTKVYSIVNEIFRARLFLFQNIQGMRNSRQKQLFSRKNDICDFLTVLRKALTCYYLTEDGPFNGTSQRVYKRTAAA